jgi:hypothetical protein
MNKFTPTRLQKQAPFPLKGEGMGMGWKNSVY